MGTPEAIIKRNNLLEEIVTAHPEKIPIDVVCDYIDMDMDCFRDYAMRGFVPFAICGNRYDGGNRFAYIPTLAFYNWVTQGAMFNNYRR